MSRAAKRLRASRSVVLLKCTGGYVEVCHDLQNIPLLHDLLAGSRNSTQIVPLGHWPLLAVRVAVNFAAGAAPSETLSLPDLANIARIADFLGMRDLMNVVCRRMGHHVATGDDKQACAMLQHFYPTAVLIVAAAMCPSKRLMTHGISCIGPDFAMHVLTRMREGRCHPWHTISLRAGAWDVFGTAPERTLGALRMMVRCVLGVLCQPAALTIAEVTSVYTLVHDLRVFNHVPAGPILQCGMDALSEMIDLHQNGKVAWPVCLAACRTLCVLFGYLDNCSHLEGGMRASAQRLLSATRNHPVRVEHRM